MSETLAITHVKVFDGNALTGERTVVIDHGVISSATTADRTVDGQHGTAIAYAHARATVSVLHQAGVTIMAGTDANTAPASPAPIQHGEAFHDELGLLVEAGLTPVEALRSATVVPAAFFGFRERGVIEAGRRADLLLIEGDPTQDIAATRAIRGVWVAGVQVR